MDQQQPILETRDLTIRFGGHTAVDKVNCAFAAKTLTAIVGPNGAGKTTYFNLISGQLKPSEGQVLFQGEDVGRFTPEHRASIGLGRAFQLTQVFPLLTVRENVRLVVQAKYAVGMKPWKRATKFRALYERADALLSRCRLSIMADRRAYELNHGDQRKLEVAMLLAMEPRVYLFDEPTAGMSVDEAPAILELIQEIKGSHDGAIILVEHKMDVIHALADRIVVLHLGQKVADGEPKEVMASPVVQAAYLGKEVAA